MYVRCAYFEGDVDPADRERFDSFMEAEIMPRLAKMPRVRAVRLLRGRAFEDDAPHFYQTIEQDYDSLEDIQNALASEIRAALREKLLEIMPLFEGRLSHINHDVTTVPIIG
ncbi:MAG: hypothetical protein V3U93_11145 [Alphaproteobacteria bacterium]